MKAKKRRYTIAQLHDRCAKVLQKTVRVKAADKNGYAYCVTCGVYLHWKDLQGGHFIERGKLSTKLLTENIHPQCMGCNHYGMKKASVVLAYRNYMVDMYGEKFVKDLEVQSREVKKFTRGELEDLYVELLTELDRLFADRDAKGWS